MKRRRPTKVTFLPRMRLKKTHNILHWSLAETIVINGIIHGHRTRKKTRASY